MTAMVQVYEFKKVRKKPVEVDAFQLTNDVWETLHNGTVDGFIKIGEYKLVSVHTEDKYFLIQTLEDVSSTDLHRAEIGDWLIKGVNDEIYACKPDIFEKTYEVVGY